MSTNPATEKVLTSLASDGLAVIERLTGVTPENAVGALLVIQTVVAALRQADAGQISPDTARAAWAQLQAAMGDNDAAADASLAAKFDESDFKGA